MWARFHDLPAHGAIVSEVAPSIVGGMISLVDRALITRLVADGAPRRQVAKDLGLARATVAPGPTRRMQGTTALMRGRTHPPGAAGAQAQIATCQQRDTSAQAPEADQACPVELGAFAPA